MINIVLAINVCMFTSNKDNVICYVMLCYVMLC